MVKKHFCQYYFSSLLGCHTKNCLAGSLTKSILVAEEGRYINFQNFKRLTKAPFIIYGHFKSILTALTDNVNFDKSTKKYQYHIVCSYGYKLI